VLYGGEMRPTGEEAGTLGIVGAPAVGADVATVGQLLQGVEGGLARCQVEENAGALAFGPRAPSQLAEIDTLLGRATASAVQP